MMNVNIKRMLCSLSNRLTGLTSLCFIYSSEALKDRRVQPDLLERCRTAGHAEIPPIRAGLTHFSVKTQDCLLFLSFNMKKS